MNSELAIQQVSFRRIRNINDLELIHARYLNHTFPRHLHEEYVIGIIVQGAEEINYRGTIYAAPVGSLILINPGEPHSNYSINECGFTYRTFYPSVALLKQINFDVTGKEASPHFLKPVIKQCDMFHSLLRLHIKLAQSDSALEQESEFISVMGQLIAQYGSMSLSNKFMVAERNYVRTAREYLESSYAENFSLR